MKEKFIIRNVETQQVLSKVNLFTDDPKMYLVTDEKHADWLLGGFAKEKTYKVEKEVFYG